MTRRSEGRRQRATRAGREHSANAGHLVGAGRGRRLASGHGLVSRFPTGTHLATGREFHHGESDDRSCVLSPARKVSWSDGGQLKHSGTAPGYLYEVAESLREIDIYPHPHPVNASKWEWLTTRELRVRLLERKCRVRRRCCRRRSWLTSSVGWRSPVSRGRPCSTIHQSVGSSDCLVPVEPEPAKQC